LFLYLKELSASSALLGITVTVGTISSLPFLYGAEKITEKIGHTNIIIIAFVAHAARLVGYSFIESAWWCFPFEAMESLSVHLMWVAAATYCALIAPKGSLATLIGVIGMAHFSIGRGCGSFIGGHLIGNFGIRNGFRIMGLSSVICGFAYFLIYFFWLRKRDKEIAEEDIVDSKEDPEPKTRDQGTMMSAERLSLVIEYNQIGSLTSLRRFLRSPDGELLKRNIRRGSDGIGLLKVSQGSTSKVDVLKNMELLKSIIKVNESRTRSAPRLAIQNSSSLTPIEDKEDKEDKELEKFIPEEGEEHVNNDKAEKVS